MNLKKKRVVWDIWEGLEYNMISGEKKERKKNWTKDNFVKL